MSCAAGCEAGACVSCVANERACGGTCAPCPTDGVASTTCDGTSCVAASCEPGYEVCGEACCTINPTWHLETVDAAGRVGEHASLAVDHRGRPHISYFDWVNADLKYAHRTGSGWSVETVDAAGSVGQYTSLALDGSGRAHISYYDDTNENLKYARWNGSDWSVDTVDAAGRVVGTHRSRWMTAGERTSRIGTWTTTS
jgi:hypothetical protein